MKKPDNIYLAVIQQVKTISPNVDGLLPIPSYSQIGALDPTDIKSIQCIVGHVEDHRE